MATKTETQVNELKINVLSEADYNTALENGEINENEIYMIPSSETGIPAGGTTGQILGWESAGKAKWCNNVKDLVVSGTYSQGRKSGSTIGENSHTEGINTEASGQASHAEGTSFSSTDGSGNTTYTFPKASGKGSHVEGLGCIASAPGGHAEGGKTTASGPYSHAEGLNSIASGPYSHAEGWGTEATGTYGHAEGYWAIASGTYSHAAGCRTEALQSQYVIGHYNSTSTATEGESNGTTGTAFVIGNGSNANMTSNACRITYDGQVIGKKAYASTGADMAEFREWLDGNPNHEDRRGYFVTMDGMNIKIAEPGDYICGIISANPSLIGNNDEAWMGRYVFDDFGAFVYEDYEETDSETGEVHKYTHYKLNPDYDPTRTYEFRADRPEWDYVGLCGVINTRDDGTCEVNGFCKCGEGGVATASERGYRVLERVNDHIVKVLFYLTGEIF